MEYKEIIIIKKIFIGGCLVGVIYGNIVSPFLSSDEGENKLIKIPSDFSGLYMVGTSSSSMAVSIPFISSFL